MGHFIAIQMDPIDAIDIRGDTTFALALEAQKRGHRIFVYGPEAIWMQIRSDTSPADSILPAAMMSPCAMRSVIMSISVKNAFSNFPPVMSF